MEYQTLPKLIRRMLKRTANGNVTLPSRRQMTTRIFAVVMFIPGIASVVMALGKSYNSALFFIISATLFLSTSLFLFGRKRVLEFDRSTQQLYLSTSIWHHFKQQRVISPLSAVTCELSSLGTQGPYQIKLAEQIYVFDQYQDAYDLLWFLSAQYHLQATESISSWPEQKPLHFGNARCANTVKSAQNDALQNDLRSSTAGAEKLNLSNNSNVYIEIWDRKSLFRLLVPFFLFTALAGLIKYGVL